MKVPAHFSPASRLLLALNFSIVTHAVVQVLDYIATQNKAVLTYSASDMKLMIHSDASYRSEPQARAEHRGGHFFLLSNESTIPTNNDAVLNIAHIIKHVMTSATEAELAALYHGMRSSVHQNSVRENGPQTTINTTTNRQRHSRGCVQRQNTT